MATLMYTYVKGVPPETSNGIIETSSIDFTIENTLSVFLDPNRFNKPGRYAIINYNTIINGGAPNFLFLSPAFNVSNTQLVAVTGFPYANMVKVDLT